MPHVIRYRNTGKVLTAMTDDRRAGMAGAGEQYSVVDDLGARYLYWHLPTLRFAQVHPYDSDARERLQAEFVELRDAWLAGCNA